MASIQDIAEFAAQLTEEGRGQARSSYRVGQDVAKLVKHARTIHRLSEIDCNQGLTDEQQRRENKVWGDANAIAATYGAELEYQGDPRGAVKLKLKSGKTNDFGGTGFCIPIH